MRTVRSMQLIACLGFLFHLPITKSLEMLLKFSLFLIFFNCIISESTIEKKLQPETYENDDGSDFTSKMIIRRVKSSEKRAMPHNVTLRSANPNSGSRKARLIFMNSRASAENPKRENFIHGSHTSHILQKNPSGPVIEPQQRFWKKSQRNPLEISQELNEIQRLLSTNTKNLKTNHLVNREISKEKHLFAKPNSNRREAGFENGYKLVPDPRKVTYEMLPSGETHAVRTGRSPFSGRREDLESIAASENERDFKSDDFKRNIDQLKTKGNRRGAVKVLHHNSETSDKNYSAKNDFASETMTKTNNYVQGGDLITKPVPSKHKFRKFFSLSHKVHKPTEHFHKSRSKYDIVSKKHNPGMRFSKIIARSKIDELDELSTESDGLEVTNMGSVDARDGIDDSEERNSQNSAKDAVKRNVTLRLASDSNETDYTKLLKILKSIENQIRTSHLAKDKLANINTKNIVIPKATKKQDNYTVQYAGDGIYIEHTQSHSEIDSSLNYILTHPYMLALFLIFSLIGIIALIIMTCYCCTSCFVQFKNSYSLYKNKKASDKTKKECYKYVPVQNIKNHFRIASDCSDEEDEQRPSFLTRMMRRITDYNEHTRWGKNQNGGGDEKIRKKVNFKRSSSKLNKFNSIFSKGKLSEMEIIPEDVEGPTSYPELFLARRSLNKEDQKPGTRSNSLPNPYTFSKSPDFKKILHGTRNSKAVRKQKKRGNLSNYVTPNRDKELKGLSQQPPLMQRSSPSEPTKDVKFLSSHPEQSSSSLASVDLSPFSIGDSECPDDTLQHVLSETVSQKKSVEDTRNDELVDNLIPTGESEKIDDMLTGKEWTRSFYTAHGLSRLGKKSVASLADYEPEYRDEMDLQKLEQVAARPFGITTKTSSALSLQSRVGLSMDEAEKAARHGRPAGLREIRNSGLIPK